jgi:hypothetical protein
MTAKLRIHEAYREANVAAARIVAADIARYGGPEAALVRWANLVLDRAGPPSTHVETIDGAAQQQLRWAW